MPKVAGNPVPVMEDFLFLFFGASDEAQQAGKDFWARRHERTLDVDPPSSVQTAKAQSAALLDWRTPHGERFEDLRSINQPTLVVNGNRDIMVPTVNSYILAQHIPNAQLVIYPDAGHAAHFQYPNTFVRQVDQFLSDERPFA